MTTYQQVHQQRKEIDSNLKSIETAYYVLLAAIIIGFLAPVIVAAVGRLLERRKFPPLKIIKIKLLEPAHNEPGTTNQ